MRETDVSDDFATKIQFRKLQNMVVVPDINNNTQLISSYQPIVSTENIDPELLKHLEIEPFNNSAQSKSISPTSSLSSEMTSVDNLEFGSHNSSPIKINTEEIANAQDKLNGFDNWPSVFIFDSSKLKTKTQKKLEDLTMPISKKEENKIIKVIFHQMRSFER